MTISIDIIPAKDNSLSGLSGAFHEKNPNAISIHFYGDQKELDALYRIFSQQRLDKPRYSVRTKTSMAYGEHIIEYVEVIAESFFPVRSALAIASREGLSFHSSLAFFSKEANKASLQNLSIIP